MAWAIFGDPDGDTVFWFHGTPGARTQLPADAAELAIARGQRIVAVERPGTGESTAHSYNEIVDFAPDLLAIADEIGADKFACVGLSGGGPYVLAAAHEHPERMTAGIVLGGIGPTRGNDAIISHTLALIPASPILHRLRKPIGTTLNAAVKLAKPLADPAVKVFFKIQPGDRAAFDARPDDLTQFTSDLISAVERRGMNAVIEDLVLFGKHWGFELGHIEVPIVFWSGINDIIVPYFHAERQSKRVPGAKLRTLEGRGHFAGYTSPGEVLDDIAGLWPIRKTRKKAAAKR